jgi:hypothetical protein
VEIDGREKDVVGANAVTEEREAAVRRWKKRMIVDSVVYVEGR